MSKNEKQSKTPYSNKAEKKFGPVSNNGSTNEESPKAENDSKGDHKVKTKDDEEESSELFFVWFPVGELISGRVSMTMKKGVRLLLGFPNRVDAEKFAERAGSASIIRGQMKGANKINAIEVDSIISRV